MTKTVPISDNSHKLLVDKQNELKKWGLTINLGDIVDICINNGINNVNEVVAKRITIK